MTIVVAIIWIVVSIIVGFAASQRGRNAFGWFLVSFLLSPVLALLLLIAFPPVARTEAFDDAELRKNIRRAQPKPTSTTEAVIGIVILATFIAAAAYSGYFR